MFCVRVGPGCRSRFHKCLVVVHRAVHWLDRTVREERHLVHGADTLCGAVERRLMTGEIAINVVKRLQRHGVERRDRNLRSRVDKDAVGRLATCSADLYEGIHDTIV
jgi:hypothetical protein